MGRDGPTVSASLQIPPYWSPVGAAVVVGAVVAGLVVVAGAVVVGFAVVVVAEGVVDLQAPRNRLITRIKPTRISNDFFMHTSLSIPVNLCQIKMRTLTILFPLLSIVMMLPIIIRLLKY
jgi:hypothetical protein